MTCKPRGFSLVEVLLCFLLLGIAALGLSKVQTYTEQQSDYAVKSLKALRLAETQLEWFRTRGASDAQSSISTASFGLITTGTKSAGEYTIDWTVPIATQSGALKTVTVTSSWEDRMGQRQSVKLKTMISRYNEFIDH